MTNLTLGTAQLISSNGRLTLRYMNRGSFLVGERTFLDRDEAIRFCADRGLRLV